MPSVWGKNRLAEGSCSGTEGRLVVFTTDSPSCPAQFLCDEGAGLSGDYIDRVDEPLSCSYVLTVRTSRLCPHPLLRPPASAAPQAILCHPALQPDEYMAYLQKQAGKCTQACGKPGRDGDGGRRAQRWTGPLFRLHTFSGRVQAAGRENDRRSSRHRSPSVE